MKPGVVAAFIAVAAASYGVGRWRGHAPAPAPQARRVLYYHDPMHPAYRSDKPGVAPDCGMQLEPVYADGEGSAPPGTFHISADRQQLVGVRTVEVRRQPARHVVRLPGRVAADESRVYRVTTRVEGWVRQIFPGATGERVRKGQRLVAIYGRDYRMAQQSFIYALNTLDRVERNGGPEPLEQTRLTVAETRANLQNLGIDAAQIDEVARARVPQLDVRLVAPVSGLIVQRNVSPNQKLEPGTELYRLVDLDRVWVLADLFPDDAQHVRGGAPGRVRLPADRAVHPARVSDALPQWNPARRSLEVRLEVDNPRLALRPDMPVDVEIPADLPPSLTVPADAVMDTGLEQRVFVDRGGGFFEPRPVRIGWRLGDLVEVIDGLEDGARVVAAGTFLVDAESRLQRSTGERDPVCGMTVDPGKARRADFKGRTYYFCSDRCKHQMEASPARYLRGRS